MWNRNLKFKVGDLVIIKGVESMFGFTHIEEGSVGVITELLCDTLDHAIDSYFFDYTVLIGGREYFLFEEEIETFFSPCVACECDPCDCNWGLL